MDLSSAIDKILVKYQALEQSLITSVGTKEYSRLAKEYSAMQDIIEYINQYKKIKDEITDLKQLLESADTDQEMRELASEEKDSLSSELPQLEQQIRRALIPKDEADSRNAIIELRAGAGGDEAALFASELFRMYQRYAENRKWKFEYLEIQDDPNGGYKEAVAIIKGQGVFARLKFESGTHRVQRVPITEASGRIHTSTATVAVLPEAEEIDVKIDEKDLRIDTYRSSGPGGQHVNTTDSAVRITHLPTGIAVAVQDGRSQLENKEKAFRTLRSRLYELKRMERDQKTSASRKEQVGTGDRSAKIRTYNFHGSRVTDHRINKENELNKVLREADLDPFIDNLIAQDEAAKLGEMV